MILGVPLAVWNQRAIGLTLLNATAGLDDHHRIPDERYGKGPRRVLDVYIPTRGDLSSRPVVVFWHGGMWMRGSKEDVEFVGAALADIGFVVVVPNYRLHPEVAYPAFVDDARRAVQWVTENAPRFGGDPDRIVLMGHSAGAYLAAAVALESPSIARGVRGWIGLSGPYLLDRQVPRIRAIFGGDGTDVRYALPQLVTPESPPALIVDSAEDWLIGPEHAEGMKRALEARGVLSARLTLPDGSHASALLALSRAFRDSRVHEGVCQFVLDVTATQARCGTPRAD